MIVATDDLPSLQRKVAMVDGGFDPLHAGHVAYFRAVAELGVPVLCNVSGDEYVSRKHPPLLREAERVEVIDAIRYIDYVHLSHTSTVAVLRKLRPPLLREGHRLARTPAARGGGVLRGVRASRSCTSIPSPTPRAASSRSS